MLAGKFKKGFDRWDNFLCVPFEFRFAVGRLGFCRARSEYLSGVAAAHHP